MDELKRKRIQRSTDSRDWTPKDALEAALDDLQHGEAKANKAIILLINETQDEPFTIEAVRSNLSRVEEVGYLELFKSMKLNDWQGR